MHPLLGAKGICIPALDGQLAPTHCASRGQHTGPTHWLRYSLEHMDSRSVYMVYRPAEGIVRVRCGQRGNSEGTRKAASGQRSRPRTIRSAATDIAFRVRIFLTWSGYALTITDTRGRAVLVLVFVVLVPRRPAVGPDPRWSGRCCRTRDDVSVNFSLRVTMDGGAVRQRRSGSAWQASARRCASLVCLPICRPGRQGPCLRPPLAADRRPAHCQWAPAASEQLR